MKSAIVGCGSIAKVHAQALHSMQNAEFVGFADIKLDRAENFAAQYGGTAYSSLEAMLKNEKIDVLHICTPHYLHVPMAITALKENIHVVMEKPCAISPAQEQELKAVQTTAKIGICFQNRYNASTQAVREILQSGKAGKIKGARAFVTWHRDEPYYTQSGWRGSWVTEGGGVLINQSIHTLDLLIYLLGDPTSVEASIHNHHLKNVIEVEDTAEAYITFGEIPALFYATTAYCADAPVMLEIICENMTIRLEGNHVTRIDAQGNRENVDFEKLATAGKDCWGSGHLSLIRDFYQCVEENKPFPIDYAEGCRAINLMFGIYQSNKAGEAITL